MRTDYPLPERHGPRLMRLLAVCAAAFLACAPTVHAAREGSAGDVSRGLVTVSLTIEPSVRISAASHINLRISNRNVDTNYSELFCVQGNGGGKYTIVAYPGIPSAGNTFSLLDDSGAELPYEVAYRGNVSLGYATLTPNVASPQYELRSWCGEDSNFRVRFRAADLQRARSGLYAGSLTLVVRPV